MSTDASVPLAKNEDSPRGFAFALTAYLLWGFLPIYMKAVAHISPAEVIAHRIVWSLPLAGIVLIVLGRTEDIRAALSSPRMLAMAALTASLITVNWGTYVWAIGTGHSLDAALGYFINPLFSIFLGAVLLKERLQPLQIAAIALAALAVGILALDSGGIPWVALTLAISWGFYALLRKTLPLGPNQGFFLEVLILSGPALLYILYLEFGSVLRN
ncbi:EamA family transporter RarD, partial [Rhizobium leguminosarum]